MRRFTCMVIAAGMLSIGDDAGGQADTSPAKEPSLHEKPEGVQGDGKFPLQAADPIGRFEFQRCCELLGLAAPQRLFANEAWERYREQAKHVVAEHAAELWRLSYAAAAGGAPKAAPDYALRMAALSSKEDEACRAMAALDAGLFAEIESILAEQQLPALQRVRQRRERQYCFLIDAALSVVDVSMLLERILTAEERAGADALLAEYERAITPMYRKLHAAMRAQRLLAAESMVRLAEAIDRNDAVASNASMLEIREGYSRAIDLQKPISQMNNPLADRIADLIGGDRGEDIRDTYYAHTYNQLFPDSLDARKVYIAARDMSSGEQRDAVEALYQSYRSRHRSLGQRLIAEYDGIREFKGRNLHYPKDEAQTKRMRRMREDRWEADVAFVSAIAELMAPPADSTLARLIREHADMSKRVLEVAENDRFPLH